MGKIPQKYINRYELSKRKNSLTGEKRRILSAMLKTPDKWKKVVDIGCGSGIFPFCLSNIFENTEFIGIDGDKQYIGEAKKIYQKKNLRFIYSHITDINFDNQVDAVIFSEVIEHLPNVGTNLEVITQIIKPGGDLFVTTDNAFSFFNILSHIFRSYFRKRPHLYLWHNLDRYYWWNQHIYSWTISTLSTLLTLYGYEVKEYWTATHYPKNSIKGILYNILGFIFPPFCAKIVLHCIKVGDRKIIYEYNNDINRTGIHD